MRRGRVYNWSTPTIYRRNNSEIHVADDPDIHQFGHPSRKFGMRRMRVPSKERFNIAEFNILDQGIPLTIVEVASHRSNQNPRFGAASKRIQRVEVFNDFIELLVGRSRQRFEQHEVTEFFSRNCPAAQEVVQEMSHSDFLSRIMGYFTKPGFSQNI